MLYKKPRGMFITIHDKGNIDAILANWPEEDVKVRHHFFTLNLDYQLRADLDDIGEHGRLNEG
jgi:hypothetical protein